MSWRGRFVLALLPVAILGCTNATQSASEEPAPLVIQEQGSFAVGGTVVTAPGTFDPIAHGAYDPADQSVAGQTLHGDHAYVFYQVPAEARPLPLVMWHGHGQSGKTWETTPDGREGFQTIFLRRRFPVYLVDQPRRGRVPQRRSHGSAGGARRPALVRDLPYRRLAGVLPGRSVLEEECGGDEDLRREVLPLLSGTAPSGALWDPQEGEVTEAGAGEGDPRTASRAGDTDLERVAARLGGRLDHYEIVSPIGVGGMGAGA